MSAEPLQINGATLALDGDGAAVKYDWFPPQPISREDVLKIRDWLNLNFPDSEKAP